MALFAQILTMIVVGLVGFTARTSLTLYFIWQNR